MNIHFLGKNITGPHGIYIFDIVRFVLRSGLNFTGNIVFGNF